MIEQKRKEMLILADTIQGEINRICATNEIVELDNMVNYAINNIKKLHTMRREYDFNNK